MRLGTPLVVVVLLGVVPGGLAGVGVSSAAAARSVAPSSAAARDAVARQAEQLPGAGAGIRVQGSQLLDGGVPWMPRGVQVVGLVAPKANLWGKYVAAAAHFSATELATAVADNANLVRFQVSEFGLDPQSPIYSPGYGAQIQQAVGEARALGLNVIVSLQAQPPAGEWVRCPLPDAGAARAWSVLAPMFAGDDGVMFELYNEPSLAATPANWQTWLNGGFVGTAVPTCEAVGIQGLVDQIRAAGADNVIIVPGLGWEQTLAGMPAVLDPASPQDPQLAYGVHYPSLSLGITAWDQEFGARSASVPVIVTEWNANSTTNCAGYFPSRAPLLLDYLAGKGIGIVGFALDLPGTLIADWSYQPTSYAGFACGAAAGGPGQLLFGDFSAEARQDGSTAVAASPAPAWLLSASTLTRLRAAAPLQAVQEFDTPRTFVTGAGTPLLQTLGAPAAVPTRAFVDERALAAAVRSGTLPRGTEAVAYEDQAAGGTPRAQQLHPALYYQRAAAAAHRAGLLLVAAPAINLVSVLAPSSPPAAAEQTFLRLKLAAAAARYADVYVVGAQDSELDPDTYSRFVAASAAQASAVHPGIELLAGLTTASVNGAASASMLRGAVLTTQGTVAGYSLSDPAATAACSVCEDPTAVAAAFLQALNLTGN